MGAILYVETNFPICIAKGQDIHADRLLSEVLPGCLVIPSGCYLEALSVLRAEQFRFRELFESLDRFVHDAGRDATSADSASFKNLLEGSRTAGAKVLNAIEQRLYDTLSLLPNKAETIDASAPAIQSTRLNSLVANDPTDSFILASILEHAATFPDREKGFLSGNTKDFDKSVVRKALKTAGIQYFGTAESASGWLRSRRADSP